MAVLDVFVYISNTAFQNLINMKRVIYLVSLSLIVILLGCADKNAHIIDLNDDHIEDEINSDTLKVLWQVPLDDDTLAYSSIHPKLYNGNLLFSRKSFDTLGDERLMLIDVETKELKWSWDNYIKPNGVQQISDYAIIGDLFQLCSHQDNYAIDLNTGFAIWGTNLDDGDPTISVYEDKVFHTFSYGYSPHGDSSKIVMCDAENGEWKDVFKVVKIDEFEVGLYPPAVTIAENSDTILIFQNKRIEISPYKGEVDLYCYNLTHDSIVWKRTGIDIESNIREPIIENGNVIFVGNWSLFCLDLETGVTRWKRTYDDHFGLVSSNYLLFENQLIYKRDNGDLYCVDIDSGLVIWSVIDSEAGACCTEMRIYDDRIYYGNGELFIIDVYKGEVLHKYDTPNSSQGYSGAIFRNAIAVDLENKKMYTTDGYFLICMELPE
jgi:outer membrane protein assembly factor BamB